jgi:hypothetical protein
MYTVLRNICLKLKAQVFICPNIYFIFSKRNFKKFLNQISARRNVAYCCKVRFKNKCQCAPENVTFNRNPYNNFSDKVCKLTVGRTSFPSFAWNSYIWSKKSDVRIHMSFSDAHFHCLKVYSQWTRIFVLGRIFQASGTHTCFMRRLKISSWVWERESSTKLMPIICMLS